MTKKKLSEDERKLQTKIVAVLNDMEKQLKPISEGSETLGWHFLKHAVDNLVNVIETYKKIYEKLEEK